MAGYKDYVLEFKLGDGTTHRIPFRVPLGENGGYYTPAIEQISDTEIKISYVPSIAGMPTIQSVVVKIPGSGGNVEKHNTDPTSHADIRKHLTVANIVESASGNVIVLEDAAGLDLNIEKLYGKTTQNGTPTPETPVPLESAGEGGSILVKVCISETDTQQQEQRFPTPNGLPGIHVTSGGNYTDENGQQWICDEIDFDRGVYVQRIGKVSNLTFQVLPYSNGYPVGDSLFFYSLLPAPMDAHTTDQRMSLSNKLPYNRGALTNDINGFYVLNARVCCRIKGISDLEIFNNLMEGAEFVVPLEPPIEKPLSDAERAAYAALHTYYPHTTILNDAGAGMEVQYVADTKLYVDKKFAELSAALLNQ